MKKEKIKIAFFEIDEEWEKEFLEKHLKKRNFELFFSEKTLTLREARKIKDFQIVSPFVYSKISKKILERLPKLKFISTRSTGFDHIDLEECRKRKIKVSNVPSYGENTVAEHTFALILALSRKLCPCCAKAKECFCPGPELTGFDLKGKTLGVVGTGRIGMNVIRIAKGFGMRVLAYDIKPQKKMEKRLGFRYVSFEEVLSKSDIITLHVPLNRSTYHMINEKTFKLFKKGSYLINTARGAVVDTRALIKALDEGILAGAGLDVLEGEKFLREERELLSKRFPRKTLEVLLENHILMKYPNVIITPHNAFNSKEALLRILETTVKNIFSFVKGKPINLVK